MELAATAMTERQRKYRASYRERVAGWYNGWLHVVLIYTIGFTALYVYTANIHAIRPWEWLTVPAVFLIANFLNGPCIDTSCIVRRMCRCCAPSTAATP